MPVPDATSLTAADQRKEIIEELKIIQDILLKQESYAIGTMQQAFVILAALVVALFSRNAALEPPMFAWLSCIVVLSFLYVQIIYRAAFHRARDRSHYLQRLLGNRVLQSDPAYEPFKIFETVNDPRLERRVVFQDLNNARFMVPNITLCIIPVFCVWLKLF